MDSQRESLFDEAHNKFMKLASYLESELKRLYDDGVLTKTDWMKLVEDSKLSGQAVIKAINRTDFPPEMQKELVKNLIAQYEESIEQILQNARDRRYMPERIEEQLLVFEKPVRDNLEKALNAKTISRRQFQEVLNQVKVNHKDIVKGIRLIPSNHPKKAEIIESWLNSYQQQMEKLAVMPTPQLGDVSNKEISPEYTQHLNPSIVSEPLHNEINEKHKKSRKLFLRLKMIKAKSKK